jgi:hypothetical protein
MMDYDVDMCGGCLWCSVWVVVAQVAHFASVDQIREFDETPSPSHEHHQPQDFKLVR